MVGDALDTTVIPTRESLELEIEAQFMKLRDRMPLGQNRRRVARPTPDRQHPKFFLGLS
jgi:hypothetical protein